MKACVGTNVETKSPISHVQTLAEARTLAAAIDALVAGEGEKALDVLCTRFLCLEKSTEGKQPDWKASSAWECRDELGDNLASSGAA